MKTINTVTRLKSRPGAKFFLRWWMLALGLAGCQDSQPVVNSDVNKIADRYLEAWKTTFPESATLSGVADAPHDRLPDQSLPTLATWQALEDSLLAALDAIDPAAFEPGDPRLVTHGFLSTVIRTSVNARVCRMELWNVSPTYTGWLSVFASVSENQPLATPEQRDAAARRFSEIPAWVEREIANLREGLKLGYTAPRNNVIKVIEQAEAYLNTPVEEAPFVVMAADSFPDFKRWMTVLEADAIRPAVASYRDFLRTEYLDRARTTVGVSANPDGAACYLAAVQQHATVMMIPEVIHQIGQEQMDRIRGEMSEIAMRLFGSSDVSSALNKLRTDRQYLVGSREAMLTIARSAVERAQAAVPERFGLLPKAAVVVEPVPAFAEATAPGAFYTNPAEDGSRPGLYSINLRDAGSAPRAGVEATAFHEALPGHHLQGALAQERSGLHPVSRFIYLSGFGEGWALYSERLADEMGLYSGDVDRMGLLSNEALRAARLVVDAGMHGLGWTREQAIEYMLANTAESPASVSAEVDRYLAVPGQATAYMLGNLEIRRLRAQAEAALGDKFDIKVFHDRVLEDGSVPLSMLTAKIERWLGN